MKKIIAVLLAGVLLLGLIGCRNAQNPDADPLFKQSGQTESGSGTKQDDNEEAYTDVEWAAQYIRTNGGYEATVLYPCVRIIHSVQELNDYYNTWHEDFDLEHKDKVYSDTTIDFLDACDQYDEAFFEKNYLIFVVLEEGSGSIRHEVRSIQQTADKKISISIDRKVPELGTADMAQWHIILELSRDILVEKSIDTYLYVDGLPAYMDDKVVVPQTEVEFKEPPAGTIRTPEGDADLRLGGYDWIYSLGNGLDSATIADQNGRPISKEVLSPVTISNQFAETVYAPVPGTDTYAPTNSLGYLVKLNWEAYPNSVTYTCWPETVWEKSNVPEEKVVSQDGAFYAKPGGYVYEIVATWDDTGKGYHGSANYYVYIVGGEDHNHQAAATAQTAENPITGYCGNTWTTLYIDGEEYGFMGSNSVALTDILVNLDYNPNKVCRCMPQFRADTEFGTNYHIHLDNAFVRCDKGQAELTSKQVEQIRAVIELVKEGMPQK